MGFKDLFKPKWQNPDCKVRKAAVKNLTDPALLAEIAKKDEDNNVREAAADKLADIAKHAKDNDMCKLAVEKLTDQVLLADIAKNTKYSDVRAVAVRNPYFTDQALLAEFAMTNEDGNVRAEAASKLTNQSVLAEIVKNEKDEDVRKAAVENPNFTDQTVLANIAKNDKDRDVRKTAEGKLECSRAQNIGKNDPEKGLRILKKLLAIKTEVWAAQNGVYNVYGQLSMKLGDLVTARDAFERSITHSPEKDHRFDWAFLALIIGLQDDESLACECAAKAGTIKIQNDFANAVRHAYIAWRNIYGNSNSRLPHKLGLDKNPYE